MADVDSTRSPELNEITIAAVLRAAGRGLLTKAEAEKMIDRLRAHPMASPLSIQDTQSSNSSWGLP